MLLHDFDELFSHYSEIIAEMEEVFTAHQFIARLGQRHQRAYIEALNAYRHSRAPFELVHQRLEDMLHKTPECQPHGHEQNCSEMWGIPQPCSRWRRVAVGVPTG